MKLLMTLLVRNEADIVRENIEFHLYHGVEHIVATDNGSTDGTTEILREYERAGCLTLLYEPSPDYLQAEWVTRMALLGRERFGAEWIINNDADEFWCPESRGLTDVLAARKEDALVCSRRNMVASAESVSRGESWSENLIYRVKRPYSWPDFKDPLTDRLPHPYFYFIVPNKLILRSAGLTKVGKGGHTAQFEHDWQKGSCKVNIYHFPVRSKSGFERSVRQIGEPSSRGSTAMPEISWKYRRWFRMLSESGSIDRAFRETLPRAWRLGIDRITGRVVRDRSLQHKLAAIPALRRSPAVSGSV